MKPRIRMPFTNMYRTWLLHFPPEILLQTLSHLFSDLLLVHPLNPPSFFTDHHSKYYFFTYWLPEWEVAFVKEDFLIVPKFVGEFHENFAENSHFDF